MKKQLRLIFVLAVFFSSILHASEEWIDPLVKKIDSMALSLEQKLNTSTPPKAVFDINKYGAVADGKTLTTASIQKAIDDCSQSGGGRVLIAAGKYMTGTIVMKDNVEIHIAKNAVLIGSPNPGDYLVHPGNYRNNTDAQVDKSLILAEKASNIRLTGEGTIDFNGGAAIFQTGIGNDIRRPFGIRFISCRNILIEGLFLTDSAQWLQQYLDCENVRISKIKVYNHANKNNDGIDIDGSRNVLVTDCDIDSDDDGIVLKSNGPNACENVLVQNCVSRSHCNALKCGTESTGGFKNIVIRDCKVRLSAHKEFINGVASTHSTLTLIITDGGTMENVLVERIDGAGPITPIFITLGNRMRPYTDNAPELPVGTVRNIKIADFTSTGAGPIASSITGLDSKHLLQNVTLENIKTESLFPATESVRDIDDTQFVKIKKGYPNSHRLGELPAYGLYARFVDGLTLKNVSMKLSCKEQRPPAEIVDCKNVVVDNFKADADNKSAPTIKFERTENVQEQSAATNRHSS